MSVLHSRKADRVKRREGVGFFLLFDWNSNERLHLGLPMQAPSRGCPRKPGRHRCSPLARARRQAEIRMSLLLVKWTWRVRTGARTGF